MFETLISDAQIFLQGLAQNNTRDWFQTHKSDYDTKLRDPAKALLDVMSPRLQKLTGFDLTPKLFRANRDVRFSKDKTPYNTHLHMLWTVQSGARQDPALFFGIDTEKVTVGTGMFEFSKDVLMDWRKMVDLDGAHISTKLDAALSHGYELWPPKLKRVPPPYDKAHVHRDLLRHKGVVVTGNPDLSGNLPDALEAAFTKVWPVSDMLIGLAETPVL